MNSLKTTDKKILEKLFKMEGGFVLSFTDNSMERFFKDDFGIAVYDEKYDLDFLSKSKANRLRGILSVENNNKVSEIILALVDCAETDILTSGKEISSVERNLIEKAREIGMMLIIKDIVQGDIGPEIQGLKKKAELIKEFNSTDFKTIEINKRIYLLKVLYSYYEAIIRTYYGSGLFFVSSGIDDLNDYFKVLRKRMIELVELENTFASIKKSTAFEQVVEPITSLYSSVDFLDVIWEDSTHPLLINLREEIADKDLFENGSEIHKVPLSIANFLEAISQEIGTLKKFLNQKTKSFYEKDLAQEKEKSSKIFDRDDTVRHEHTVRFENSMQEKDIAINIHDLHDSGSTKKTKNKFPFVIQSGTTWESFYIQFKNDEAVTIKVSGHTHDTSFADMGFADGRTNKPNTQWTLLKLFAKNGGNLTAGNPDAKHKYKKHKQLLSDALKSYFSMDYDPFKPYGKNDGYAIKINLSYPETEEKVIYHSLNNEIDEMFQNLVA